MQIGTILKMYNMCVYSVTANHTMQLDHQEINFSTLNLGITTVHMYFETLDGNL